MEFEHPKFGKCVLKEINQRMLEDYHRDMKGKQDSPLSVWRGDSVRSFVEHGYMIEPVMTVEGVDNAKPALIVWLADCVFKIIAEAMNIDPLS